MSLNGPNIYSFSTNIIPNKIKTFLKKTKVNKSKIKYCFLHQANKLINQSIEEKLSLKNTIFPSSLGKFGNTSSASIPVTIVDKFGGKKISGMSLISGFGVGLSSSTLCMILKIVKFQNLFFYKEKKLFYFGCNVWFRTGVRKKAIKNNYIYCLGQNFNQLDKFVKKIKKENYKKKLKIDLSKKIRLTYLKK